MAEVGRSADQRVSAAGDDVGLETLLDQLVRELYAVALGVAIALRHAEGQVAEQLSAVVDDADRLIRSTHSAAVVLRANPVPVARADEAASA